MSVMRTLVSSPGDAMRSQYKPIPTEDHDESVWGARKPKEKGPGACLDGASKGLDIVQFSCAICYVEEDEGHAAIDIMRLGSMEGIATCKFATADGSAKNGVRYLTTSEDVTFQPGEYSKTVKVPILTTDGMWTPTWEFKGQLSCANGCELGAYLHCCRVKVIDKDPFPSDRYGDILCQGLEAVETINGFGLFLEYCRLNLSCEGILWRTLLTVFMDQLQNIYLLVIILLRVYMVDTLYAMTDHTSEERLFFPTRSETAYFVAACYVAPMVILHMWDVVKIRIDLSGRSCVFLQTNIFREYLNYSEHSREEVPTNDTQEAIASDCKEVAEGYVTLLKFSSLTGKLCLFGFLIVHTSKSDKTAIYLMLIAPVLIGLFGSLRSNKLLKATAKVHHAHSEFQILVRDACENYRLFANYFQRPLVNANFSKSLNHYREAELPRDVVALNSMYFTSWLGPLLVAVYIVLCTPSIISGAMGVGVFLATIDMLTQMCNDFGLAYAEAMKMFQTCDTLRGLCVLFNMPSDLRQWKTVNRARRESTKVARDEILKSRANARGSSKGGSRGGEQQFMSDSINIFLADLNYRLPSGQDLFTLEGRLQVSQGKLVAVKGKHGSGKSTLLRLIAHELFPTSGELFVPSHLRILHVSQEVHVLQESAWTNLIFGCQQPVSDLDLKRIELVIERLGMTKLGQFIEEDVRLAKADNAKRNRSPSKGFFDPFKGEPDHTCYPFDCISAEFHHEVDLAHEVVPPKDWLGQLTYTEKVKLHLARAFLMNPEVMVLQRPLYHFSQQAQETVLQMLREHVDKKGVGMPEASIGRRRPRTVFYTAEMEHHEEAADIVWDVEGRNVLDRTAAVKSRVARRSVTKYRSAFDTVGADLMSFEEPVGEPVESQRQDCTDPIRPAKHMILPLQSPQSSHAKHRVLSLQLQSPQNSNGHGPGRAVDVLKEVGKTSQDTWEKVY